ncbi:ketoacyl-ACP synthase III [Paenibacillus sp. PL2-23]|uniref:ketoacyl-ACP synthase III n=1 Tax=Paenibacillus sp. PL2-23 TaxID=2100729 RepID=UPI0030F749FC
MTTTLQSNACVTAIGTYVPGHIITNSDLEKLVDTSDEWIVQRTGIRERRALSQGEGAFDLVVGAVHNMTERYGIPLDDVDYIIVATSTPDTVFPSMAARIQSRFGISGCGAVDLQAACAGFTAALQLGNALLLTGIYRKILIVGVDALTTVTDYTDRTTCILFGDGAGAMLLERASSGGGGCMLASYSDTDGSGGHHVYLSNSANRIDEHELLDHGKIVQNGREVYRWAVSHVSEGIRKLMAGSGMDAEQLNWFVPHNANQRIIDALCERTGFRPEQALSSISRYGNTSAASIPLALDDAVKDGRVQSGDTLLLYGFGGGLTQAGVIMRWSL